MDTVSYMPNPTPNRLKKQKLEAWQVEDAERLRALFVERTNLSQEKFGEAFGIGTQGMVWQYLNARRPLNPRAAKAFADGLRLNLASELIEKCLDMNGEEWDEMLRFADFVRSKRKR